MLEQILIAFPLILGAYITISLLKLPDFSLESAYLMGACTSTLFSKAPLAGAICGGLLVGLLVAILNQIFRIPFLIAAIITNGLFHGLAQYVLKNGVVSFHPTLIVSETYYYLVISAALIIFFALIFRSELGFSFAIFGNNPLFLQNHNLSSQFSLFSAVMLGHSLAAISGFLFATSNGFVDLTMNFGVILLALCSLLMGKLVIRSFRPNVLVPIVGSIFFFMIQYFLLRIGLGLKYFNSLQALLILALLIFGQKKYKFSIDHLGV